MSSLSAVMAVWFTVQILGVTVLPLTLFVFKNVPGRGYFFSKTFGILGVTYLTWLIASLGLLTFGLVTIAMGIALWGGVSIYFSIRDWSILKDFIRANWKYILIVELLFLATFALFTLIKSYNSGIIPRTEGFMDFALLNNILRGGGFPINDPWFSGEGVNYYYFGHITVAVLNVLSGLRPEIFFNVAVALVFSLLTVGSFSLGYSLTQKMSYGFLTSTFVALIGNLDGFLQIVGSKKFYPFDWFKSSRIIPGTINEFPFFSFLWGDLHAYVLAFPIIIMVLALGYNILMSKGSGISVFGERRSDRALHLVILGLSLGSLFIINSWDYPIYAFIIVSVIMIQQLSTTGENLQTKLIWGAALAGLVIAASIVPYVLYFGSFQQSRNIGVIADKTRLNEFLTIYGLFIFVMVSFVAIRLKEIKGARVSFLLILFAASSALIISRHYAFIFLGLTLVALAYLFLGNLKDKPSTYILLLFGTGLGLGLGGEFFYLDDHFGPPFERMNTIFKIYLQIWISWAIASAFSVYLIRNALIASNRRHLGWAWSGFLVALIGISL